MRRGNSADVAQEWGGGEKSRGGGLGGQERGADGSSTPSQIADAVSINLTSVWWEAFHQEAAKGLMTALNLPQTTCWDRRSEGDAPCIPDGVADGVSKPCLDQEAAGDGWTAPVSGIHAESLPAA